MFKKITLSAVAAATAFAAFPAAASAQYYDRGYNNGGYYQQQAQYRGQRYDDRYYGRAERRYQGERRCSGTTGTIVGGAGGALLGRGIAGRGNGTVGTIAGGVVGALLGREVGKGTCRSSRSYRGY